MAADTNQSLHPVDSVRKMVERINNALLRTDQIHHMDGKSETDWLRGKLKIIVASLHRLDELSYKRDVAHRSLAQMMLVLTNRRNGPARLGFRWRHPNRSGMLPARLKALRFEVAVSAGDLEQLRAGASEAGFSLSSRMRMITLAVAKKGTK
jgi:hypothetical protein